MVTIHIVRMKLFSPFIVEFLQKWQKKNSRKGAKTQRIREPETRKNYR